LPSDAFNDNTGLFEKVGAIGKKLGLEWGGGWTSIKDRPHFQLPDWGSTPYKLKCKYGTPEKFIKTWKKA
jgi:peptidoglycan L-alanyl-D-glutamate endopeptidase CwlK